METDPKLDKIIDMLTNIEDRLDRMEDIIKDIRENNKSVVKDCNKMSKHVDFIEKSYSAVRTPLSYIKQHVEYMLGKTSAQDLPTIEYQHECQDEK
jgi:archaellum component FlaC